jgi:hypothetical protein
MTMTTTKNLARTRARVALASLENLARDMTMTMTATSTFAKGATIVFAAAVMAAPLPFLAE